ncbi:hypothetical protein F5Y18DRAFT_159325 [Xylariaceae sp. FL1019]|nr:hypothetical protein F5Y18DRAFT_159325 [Xylariaceae sp. FL1019]
MDTSGSLSTYKRYKLGQAQFQKWLQQTSDKFKSKGGQSEATADRHDYLPAGHRARTKPSASSHGTGAFPSLHWTQLESMAQIVIDNVAPEDIPSSAIAILRDVVKLRKKSARFFSKSAKSNAGPMKDKMDSHQHIIDVLGKVLHRFDEALSRIRRPVPEPKHPDDDQLGVNDLSNMYELLKVEQVHAEEGQEEDGADPDEDVEPHIGRSKKAKKSGKKKIGGKGKGKKPRKPANSQAVVMHTPAAPQDGSWVEKFRWFDADEDEDDDDEFDYYMLIYCFFQDFNEIRSHVTDKWLDYFYHKSISVDTLAVITNAAFELFHEMEVELRKILRHTSGLKTVMGDYPFMMRTLFFDYGLDHVDYAATEGLEGVELNNKIFEEADWLGFPAYANVETLLQRTPPGKVPLLPPSMMMKVKYGLCTDSEGMQQFLESVVMEIYPEVCLTKALKTNGVVPPIIPAQDELMLEFENIFRVRNYSSAMIFDLTLWADIRYVLEDEVSQPFELLQATATSSKSILGQYLPQMKNGEYRKECQARFNELEHAVIADFMAEDKQRRYDQAGVTESFESHLLLKKNPIWSGLLDFRCRLVLNDLGYRFIKNSPLIIYAASAYAMTRTNKQVNVEWPRMDIFLRVHDKNSIFLEEGSNSTPIGLLRRLSEGNYQIGLAGISDPPQSLSAFMRRYGWTDVESRWQVQYLRDILRDSSHLKKDFNRASGLLEPGLSRLSSQSRHDLLPTKAVSQGKGPHPAREAQPLSPVSPIQLLEILEETTSDLLENELSVEYFQLYDESVLLFLDILQEFEQELENGDGDGFSYEQGDDSSKLALILPSIYQTDDTSGVSRRLGNVVSDFCLGLSEDAAK